MKKMTKAMLMTALICGTMYCGAEPVHAKELDTFALDEYVVTATRTPVKVFDANANISVVTRDEIENAHFDNLESALANAYGAVELRISPAPLILPPRPLGAIKAIAIK